MLTPEQRDDVEEVPTRQPGCPDKECSVCRANKRRTEAVAHVLLEHDRLERELADERAAHAVTQAELSSIRLIVSDYGADGSALGRLLYARFMLKPCR